jgi:hypothetical protein
LGLKRKVGESASARSLANCPAPELSVALRDGPARDVQYVPAANSKTPDPAWKRINIVQDALPARDQGKALSLGGELSFDAYADLLAKGEA